MVESTEPVAKIYPGCKTTIDIIGFVDTIFADFELKIN